MIESCYVGGKLNLGCEAAVIARARTGWVRFTTCLKKLLENRLSLKIKGKVHRCCTRSAIQ